MKKLIKKAVIILMGLCAVGSALLAGCAPTAPSSSQNPSLADNDCIVRFISAGQEFESSVVEKGEKAVVPAQTPVRDGYLFNGWDYDFNLAITEDVDVYAKWLYYSNVVLDVANKENFIADFITSEDTDGKITVETVEEGLALVARAKRQKKGETLTVSFNEEFPIGTRLVFKASYAHNEDGFSGGASVFINGEYFQSMPVAGEYAEYVYETTEENGLKSVSFRANTDAVSYTFSILETCVLTNMENVDFNEFALFDKAVTYNIAHTRSVEYDDEEKKNVLVVQMQTSNNKEQLLLNYPKGTRLHTGTKIIVRTWFKPLDIGGGCININENYRCGWIEPEAWTDYEILVDTDMDLESISLRPYNPSGRYIFKISYIKIVYPNASD